MPHFSSALDATIHHCDEALRAIFGYRVPRTPCPAPSDDAGQALTTAEKRHAAALMRVNHVGEVCAQALYNAQAASTKDPALKAHFKAAAIEEGDHLAWTRVRVAQLGGRTSVLNPLWYAGAFGFGCLAGRFGDAISLGFVVETERQVEAHLEGHLHSLPSNDTASRAIVEQMKNDEVAHAQQALDKGATPLPAPITTLMKSAAKVMTTVAYRL